MRPLIRWTLAALLVVGASAPARAQEAGDRIRVTVTNGPRVVGRFERADADALVMVGGDSIRRVIPLANVGRLDVARGSASRTRRMVRGGAMGLAIGAMAGAAVGAVAPQGDCDSSDGEFCIGFEREFAVAASAVTLGTAGLLTGVYLGATRDPTRWVSVPGTSRVQLGVRREGGFALAAAIPIR